ncbi:MAG: FAD-dependent oxidoreductase [Synergistaceae bacterium]|nr:FAD-dependent oxidoreductase [Synergistaceae bacterium]
MRKKFVAAIFIISLFVLSPVGGQAIAEEAEPYDIVVVGAGTGGCAAAIQAARMGMSVALVEQSDWVGGQMTGAAVSTMDDKTMTRTGIYLEFINRVRDFYSAWGKNVNVCYWGSDTIAFEPWVGQKILLEMLGETGHVKVILKAKLLSVKKSGNKVVSAVFDADGKNIRLNAKIFIDATECGDFIPMTGARYRAGNSVSPKIDKEGIIQDITYTAVIKRYPGGLPPELKVSVPPPGYTEYLFKFRAIIRKDGNTWPGEYPFDVPTHNAYRAMPDLASRAVIDGGDPTTWPLVTKTAINWANDYPGKDSGVPGLSVEFLESRNYRLYSERMAMAKTLAFIYYMQHELGMSDWSVDDRQGYGGWFSNNWQEWKEMPERYAPILKHFPPFPYVRESRRIIGITTMTVDDIRKDPILKRTVKNIPDSVALGEYPIDIHGNHDTKYLDKDLGETAEKIPNDGQGEGGLFQIPFGVLIPEKVNGLLAAEKNISVSRVVNGTTRLQPVTMLTGQAAGVIAALAVQQKVQPRALRPLDVQSELLRAKARLSLYRFEDVPEYSVSWPGVEASTLYGYMDPRAETNFGVYEEMHWVEIRDAFRRAFGIRDFPKRDMQEPVRVDEFSEWLKELYKKDLKRYEDVIDELTGTKVLTKGKLASTVFSIMKVSPAVNKK